MPRVQISANNILLPHFCLCCGYQAEVGIVASASKSRGKRVVHTTTRAFEFRICQACKRHCETEPDLTRHLIVNGIIVIAMACTGLFPLITLWFPFALAFYLWRKAAARAGRGQSCECMGAPVKMEGFYATEYTLWFDSGRYASAFAQVNADGGKNVMGVDASGGPAVTLGRTPAWKIFAVPGVLIALQVGLVAVALLKDSLPSFTSPSSPPSAAAQPSMSATPTAHVNQAPMVAAPPAAPVYQPPMAPVAAPVVRAEEEPRRRHRHHRH